MAITTKKRDNAKSAVKKKISRTRKPMEMSIDECQTSLRREYGQAQDFKYNNTGEETIFSDFLVTNPNSERTYRVAVRGQEPGANFCSCPDFTVNTLGTCKHIEWLLAKLERKRGGKKAFKEGFHPSYSSVYVQCGLQRKVRFRSGTECPDTLLRAAKRYFDVDGYLRENSVDSFDRFVRQAGKSNHEVCIYDDALDFVARLRDDAKRVANIAKRFGNGIVAMNKLLKVKLYPYQREGALFAAKAGRCLIADDMGLGKTIQAIAACEILAQCAGIERVLVIGPAALKHQWKNEVERFAKRTAVVVEGQKYTRNTLFKEDSFFKIMNYELVGQDIDEINAWRPDVVILGEA